MWLQSQSSSWCRCPEGHLCTHAHRGIIHHSQRWRRATYRHSASDIFYSYVLWRQGKWNQWIWNYFPRGNWGPRPTIPLGTLFLSSSIHNLVPRASTQIPYLIHSIGSLTQSSWPEQCSSWLYVFLRYMAPFQPWWAQWPQTAHQHCTLAILNRDITKKSIKLHGM